MHELNPETFNKLISSKDYVKTPAVLKSTFDLIAFFDGRCETSIKCERIQQVCPPCSKNLTTTTSSPSKTSSTTTSKSPTKSSAPTSTMPAPSNIEILQKVSTIFKNLAPQLTDQQLNEIVIAHEHLNRYTQNWTASQLHEILTKSSIISQNEVQYQNTSVNAVMRFSDEIKQHMISYTSEIDPHMSLENILGMIGVVEEIGTAAMRYLTFDQFRTLRVNVISELSKNNEVVATTEAGPTTKASKASIVTIPVTITTKNPTTKTTERPSTTKTYIAPPKNSQKPYTRWIGQTYRQFTGYYSFGYTWNPFTSGHSWRTRTFTSRTTTTTDRYGQRGIYKTFNPVKMNE
ncbi:hypothetical protein ACKWTF_016199 [Chironomus riparius]